MIDIETGREHNLKNIRQIGAPTEDDRIYIENAAYARIHEEDYAQRRAFIFMGHTECDQGKYTTFVEAAIPVHNLEFTQNIPRWGNHAWSDIFREIKRSYENSIIVGWALDIKGFAPRMTAELEAVHREQFGGAHQVLFLMDSLEGEEYFYLNKGNRLLQREGFYIYYSRDLYQMHPAEVTVEMPRRENFRVLPPAEEASRGHYRENIQKKEERKEEKKDGRKASSYAMAAAIALLVVIGGAGVAQGRISLSGIEKTIDAMSNRTGEEAEPAEVLVGTQIQEETERKETTETMNGTQAKDETQTWTETLDLIPIEELPAGEIKKTNEESGGDGQEEQETQEEESEKQEQKEEQQSSVNTSKQEEYYVVKEGDTLTGICQKLYGSTGKISEIVQLNQMDNSDDIRVGQKLRLP